MYGRRRLVIGPDTFIGPRVRLLLAPGATIVVGDHVELRQDITIEVARGASVRIESGAVLTYSVLIQCASRITIGRGTLLAYGVNVVDSVHPYLVKTSVPLSQRPLVAEPLSIGSDVWVASKATVAASIGDGCIVGAHSFVSRPLPEGVLAYGAPAVPRRSIAGVTRT